MRRLAFYFSLGLLLGLAWMSTSAQIAVTSTGGTATAISSTAWPITAPTGATSVIRTGTTAADTLTLSAYDVDGAAYVPLLVATANNATTIAIGPSGARMTFGTAIAANTQIAAIGGMVPYNGRSVINSASNGTMYLSNSAETGFDTFNLGPASGNTANGTLSISKVQVTCTIATSTNCSGAGTGTITTSTGIPAGSLVLGVDARVTTIIAGSDGIASWALGHAGDTDAWGAAIALAATTTTGIANFTITNPAYFTGATNITFSGTGGKLIDSGVIKITIYYIALTPISA